MVAESPTPMKTVFAGGFAAAASDFVFVHAAVTSCNASALTCAGDFGAAPEVTTTVPRIFGWISQKKRYVPAFGKLNVNVAGAAFGPFGDRMPLLALTPGATARGPNGASAAPL